MNNTKTKADGDRDGKGNERKKKGVMPIPVKPGFLLEILMDRSKIYHCGHRVKRSLK